MAYSLSGFTFSSFITDNVLYRTSNATIPKVTLESSLKDSIIADSLVVAMSSSSSASTEFRAVIQIRGHSHRPLGRA